ncbi:MAG: hypothetical protein F9K40_00915 [Kofleriaceae bacterium]|nr:MAG: hypothetical protein F9K40_00915 [Kofleriaceae bacterium]MBZ0234863.1 hypothetical protein [Kofleriaceae bacterium]
MIGRYTPEMMANVAELLPELERLGDSEYEWAIEGITIWKSSRLASRPMSVPTYRRGYTFELPEDMRFVSVPFTRLDGSRAIAVVLRSGTEELLAAWVREANGDVAEAAIRLLNREIEAAWDYHRKTLAPAADEPPASERAWLTFEQGSEEAPDAPWGLQRLRISNAGDLRYEHRNRGRNRTVSGRIDPARCRRVFEALSSTAFPAPPQTSFLPGASGLVIECDAPRGRVIVDYFDGLKMDGYRDVISELSGLNAALRTGDKTAFSEWGLVETPGA